MALHKFRHFVKYILIDILLAALISFVVINYLISAFKIDGDSMSPVLKAGERILISKLAARRGNFDRFDIVVFYKPDEPEKSLIKRIVGLPDEIIEIRQGEVLINYKPLKEGENLRVAAAGEDFKPLLIPRGHYFLLGDNRPVSRDSRLFGPVPQKYIYGKAIFRYWPLGRMGRFH